MYFRMVVDVYTYIQYAWTSKRAQNNGPICQNREQRRYRAYYFGDFGGTVHINIVL